MRYECKHCGYVGHSKSERMELPCWVCGSLNTERLKDKAEIDNSSMSNFISGAICWLES